MKVFEMCVCLVHKKKQKEVSPVSSICPIDAAYSPLPELSLNWKIARIRLASRYGLGGCLDNWFISTQTWMGDAIPRWVVQNCTQNYLSITLLKNQLASILFHGFHCTWLWSEFIGYTQQVRKSKEDYLQSPALTSLSDELGWDQKL